MHFTLLLIVGAPIDGGLGEWSQWSQCKPRGIASRTRLCNRPPPAREVQSCRGHVFEAQFCLFPGE